MGTFAFDSMTDSNWRDLHLHAGELGAIWARNGATPSARFYVFDGRVHCGQVNGTAGAALYASGVPPSPDYTVACDYTVKTNVGHVGIAGRMSPTANTYYFTYLDPDGHLILAKRVNGLITTLDSAGGVMGAGSTYLLELDMDDDEITVRVDSSEVCGVTDSSITAAGFAGVRSGSVNDAHIGKHIDNFRAFDGAAPPAPGVQQARSIVAVGL